MKSAGSIKAKLRNLAEAGNKSFDYLLIHYFIERYDKDHLLLRVDAKLFLASNGIYVTGEDEKAHRILSQDDLRTYAAGKKGA